MTTPRTEGTTRTLTSIALLDILRASLAKVEVTTIDDTLTALVQVLRFDPQVYAAQQALQGWIDTLPHDIDEVIPQADHFIGKD